MEFFSDSLRKVFWILLCLALVIGMLSFAFMYAGISVLLKNLAWKNFEIPSLKIVK